MLPALLDRTRPLARLLALLLAVGTALPAALHAGWDEDPFCEPALATDDAPHAWRASTGDAQARHCDSCHWLRSLRGLDATPAGMAADLAAATQPSAERLLPPTRRLAASLSARAPPA
jgi:hypothetical protein